MRPNDQGRGVAVYLLFTLALSSVFYFLIARSGRNEAAVKLRL
jgi:hypothetical protein